MNKELFDRIAVYKATMAAVKSMLDNNLISAEEYSRIETMIACKYDLNSSVIFR